MQQPPGDSVVDVEEQASGAQAVSEPVDQAKQGNSMNPTATKTRDLLSEMIGGELGPKVSQRRERMFLPEMGAEAGKYDHILGSPLSKPDWLVAERHIGDIANEAIRRIDAIFGVRVEMNRQGLMQIDTLVSRGWRESGWAKNPPDIDLLATDLGCIFAVSIRDLTGGTMCARDNFSLDHVSVVLPDGREIFPFHKVIDVLSNERGEPLTAFVTRLLGGGQ